MDPYDIDQPKSSWNPKFDAALVYKSDEGEIVIHKFLNKDAALRHYKNALSKIENNYDVHLITGKSIDSEYLP